MKKFSHEILLLIAGLGLIWAVVTCVKDGFRVYDDMQISGGRKNAREIGLSDLPESFTHEGRE